MENQNLKPHGIDIDDYLSRTLAMAAKTDEALIAARKRAFGLKYKTEKLREIFDAEQPHELSKEECQELIEALIADNTHIMEEQRICYLRGYLDGVESKKTFEG